MGFCWRRTAPVSHVTHLIFSNTLTVVSLARAVTRFTTSTRMEDRRKRDTISAEHCCTDGHPAGEKHYWTQPGLPIQALSLAVQKAKGAPLQGC